MPRILQGIESDNISLETGLLGIALKTPVIQASMPPTSAPAALASPRYASH